MTWDRWLLLIAAVAVRVRSPRRHRLAGGVAMIGDLIVVAVLAAAVALAVAVSKAYGRWVSRRLAEERTDEIELRAWSAAMRSTR